MNLPVEPPPLPPRTVSPLLRAMAQPERKELDPWLAGMNALALCFILTAFGVFLPRADASRTPAFPVKMEEAAMDDSLAMDLSPPPPSAEAPAPETSERPPAAEPASEPEAMDLPPPVELPAYRELPEMIDPVPVQDPPRLPTPAPAESRRPEPAPRPAAKPTTPATRPGPAPASNPGTAPGTGPRGGAAGPSGGTPGGTGPGPRAGNGTGRGTTPQPPYPAFARRDRLQGTVVVSIAVVNGAVTAVRLITSSGHASLDQYAISHVQRRWKWSAGTTRTFTQPFRFVLK